MTNSSLTKRTAAALAGAVALASGAYGLGSQAGDGSAVAARTAAPATAPAGFGGQRRGDLDALASALGVSAEKLRTALDEIRDERKPSARDREKELAAALAGELGVSEARVSAALEKLRDAHEAEHEARHRAFAAAVARELGIDAAKVREAFGDARPDRGSRRGPREALGDVAAKLGVSDAKLRAALRAARRDLPRRDRGERHGRGDLTADLAKELGVSEAKVEAAFDKLHERHEAEHEEREAAFAKALAAKLGISEAKVRDAFESVGGPVRGHHGPGGHGPGGPGGPRFP